MKALRVPLLGLRRRFERSARGRGLPFHLIDRASAEALALGYRTAEISWVLEDNRPMRHIAEAAGARVYKTYRLYDKALA